jgi:hypothetical protein
MSTGIFGLLGRTLTESGPATSNTASNYQGQSSWADQQNDQAQNYQGYLQNAQQLANQNAQQGLTGGVRAHTTQNATVEIDTDRINAYIVMELMTLHIKPTARMKNAIAAHLPTVYEYPLNVYATRVDLMGCVQHCIYNVILRPNGGKNINELSDQD